MMEKTKHPLAGRTVKLKKPFTDHFGEVHNEFWVEDSWLNITGKDWMTAAMEGNPACLTYMHRHKYGDFKDQTDVVYGKTGKFGNLFNVEELVVDDNH
jgi:hypothetical protein